MQRAKVLVNGELHTGEEGVFGGVFPWQLNDTPEVPSCRVWLMDDLARVLQVPRTLFIPCAPLSLRWASAPDDCTWRWRRYRLARTCCCSGASPGHVLLGAVCIPWPHQLLACASCSAAGAVVCFVLTRSFFVSLIAHCSSRTAFGGDVYEIVRMLFCKDDLVCNASAGGFVTLQGVCCCV